MDNLLERLGLTPADFEKPAATDSERLDMLEEALIELAEIITEG